MQEGFDRLQLISDIKANFCTNVSDVLDFIKAAEKRERNIAARGLLNPLQREDVLVMNRDEILLALQQSLCLQKLSFAVQDTLSVESTCRLRDLLLSATLSDSPK